MVWYDVVDELWNKKITEHGEPHHMSEIIEVDYSALASAFLRQDSGPFRELLEPLSTGAFLILRDAFSISEATQLKEISLALRKSEGPSFSKIVEGCPNFWRDITEDETKSYSIKSIKKSSYFFPWNPTSSAVFKLVYPRWRVAKLLGGKPPTIYETNTPKDGSVDRIQIVEYPPGTGQIEPHRDPTQNQRIIISAYLSKKGVDYQGGGFWAMKSNGEKSNPEESIQVGDMGVCYADIIHGVDATDANLEIDMENFGTSARGSRWFLGLYTVDSDEIDSRKTSIPVQLE